MVALGGVARLPHADATTALTTRRTRTGDTVLTLRDLCARGADAERATAATDAVRAGGPLPRPHAPRGSSVSSPTACRPRTPESLSAILDKQIADLQNHVNTRLGSRSFVLEVPPEARRFLLEKGTSAEYGARELNRTIHRHLTQPLATLVATNQVRTGDCIEISLAPDGNLRFTRAAAAATVTAAARSAP